MPIKPRTRLTKVSGFRVWGPTAGWLTSSPYAVSTHNMSSSSTSIETIFIAPKTGYIDKVGCHINAIVGNPPPYNIGLVTVDSSGNPTTTAYGGSSIESYDFTNTGWYWITLSTPATIAAGAKDIIAVKIWPGETAPDASNYARITRNFVTLYGHSTIYTRYYSGGWLTNKTADLGAMYSDGSVALPSHTNSSNQYYYYRTSSTPNEIGCLFQLPFDCLCNGAQFTSYGALTTSDFTVNLYDANNSTLASFSMDVSQAALTSYGIAHAYWDAVSLKKNTYYRLTVLPTQANYVYLGYSSFNEAASRYWWPEGERWQYTARTGAGAWSEDALQLPMMGLILSEITVPL